MVETRTDVVTLPGLRAWTSIEVPAPLEPLVIERLRRYQSEAESLMKRPCSVVVTDEVITDRLGSLLVTRRRPVATVEALAPAEPYVITSSGLLSLTGLTRGAAPVLAGPVPHMVSYTSTLRPEDLDTVVSCIYERMVRSVSRETDETQGVISGGEEGLSLNLQDSGWLEGERAALLTMKRRSSA